MNWTIVIIAAVVVAALYLLKRMSLASPETVRQLLAQGAVVIDVRSPEEFRDGHVPHAINIPLGELRANLPRHVQDKNQPLLLHCLSGGRSAIAKSQLRSLGYPNVFNLGSLTRAQHIYAESKRNQGPLKQD